MRSHIIMKTISCVIPAYNEQKSLRNTLEAVTKAGVLHEVIVVDDCSKDDTSRIAREFPAVKVLVNEKNRGKSQSVARGVSEAAGEYILMLDADLLGLTSRSIKDLVAPIGSDGVDICISMRRTTPGWMKRAGVDFMSGERVIPRATFMGHIEELSKLGNFGLEVFLNRIIIADKLRIRSVMLEGVANDMKWQKRSFWVGVRDELLMWRDIFKVISPWEFVSQNVVMRRLLNPAESGVSQSDGQK